jgi:hypothetical protein
MKSIVVTIKPGSNHDIEINYSICGGRSWHCTVHHADDNEIKRAIIESEKSWGNSIRGSINWIIQH